MPDEYDDEYDDQGPGPDAPGDGRGADAPGGHRVSTWGEGTPAGGPMPPAPAGPRPVPPVMPPLPEPWTTADGLRLQRLQAGLSQAQQQVDSGELTEVEGENYKQQILRMQQPLLARREASRRQQEEEQRGQVMHDTALGETMEQAHALSQAEAFPRTVASFTNPLTGETKHFYPSERGKWEPVDFPSEQGAGEEFLTSAGTPDRPEEAPAPAGQGDMAGYRAGPLGQGGGGEQAPMPREAPDYRPDESLDPDQARQQPEGPPDYRPDPSLDPDAAGGQRPAPPPPPQQPQGPVPLREYVQIGRPMTGQRSPQAGAAAGPDLPGVLSEHEMGVLRQRAERAVRPVFLPPGGVQTPRQAQFVRHQVLQRQKAVQSLVQHWAGNLLRGKEAQAQRSYQEQEHRRLEASREAEHQRVEQAKSEERQRREQEASRERQRQEEVRKQERIDKEYERRMQQTEKVREKREVTEQQHRQAYRHYLDTVLREKDKEGNRMSAEAAHSEAVARMEREYGFFAPRPGGKEPGGKNEAAGAAEGGAAPTRQEQEKDFDATMRKLLSTPPAPTPREKRAEVPMKAPPTPEMQKSAWQRFLDRMQSGFEPPIPGS